PAGAPHPSPVPRLGPAPRPQAAIDVHLVVPGVPGSPPCRQRATIGVMGTVLLVLVVVLVVAALVFGVVSMLSGDDPGLSPAEPDSRAVALPNNRSLTEA